MIILTRRPFFPGFSTLTDDRFSNFERSLDPSSTLAEGKYKYDQSGTKNNPSFVYAIVWRAILMRSMTEDVNTVCHFTPP